MTLRHRGSRGLRLPASAHFSQPWRIHELAGDFRLEDVWALPTPGDPDDFAMLMQLLTSRGGPLQSSSGLVRGLWAARKALGALFGWDEAPAGNDSGPASVRDRLPADLAGRAGEVDVAMSPFTTLYLLRNEWAAELDNKTMHGVVHIGWVEDRSGRYRGQLAVLVKPHGLFGAVYMAAIRPFRHLVVYPLALRETERAWREALQDRQRKQLAAALVDDLPAGDGQVDFR